jgi:hypothetical protein
MIMAVLTMWVSKRSGDARHAVAAFRGAQNEAAR